MDVIGSDIQFKHFHLLLSFTEFLDRLVRVVRYVILEDPVTILRTEYDVIFALIQRVR